MTNGFFSEDKVSEIRDRSSILEVVSDYVTLKKTGKNHKGLCPFHSEKTPSFMVNEEKQIFHCFGCGEGGDVFTFLMKVGHFSFPQVVEKLANKYGVALPRRELSLPQKREMAKKEGLFQINQVASDYFHDLLTRRKEGEQARKYLAERGVRPEITQEHRLGYSLDRWDGLVQHLLSKKMSPEMAKELGLIHPKRKEGWYDTFRGRIIFPIFDLHNRVVGFGGRILKEGQPKYLNSPESSIYHKGEVLYGLQVARRYAQEKDCMIIVEGYFDLLALHQYGQKHCVATLGTALTAQHLRTVKRYTHNVITLFDADPAGVQATLRSLPLLLEEGVAARTISLPRGEDPDGFLRKARPGDFEEKVDGAPLLIDFFFDRLMKTHDVKSIEGRVKIAEGAVALIQKIPDKIRKDFYIRALAEKLDIRVPFLYEMLRSPAKDRHKIEEDLEKRSQKAPFPKSEEMVVLLMVHHPELIPAISEEGIAQEFESPILRTLAEGLERLYRQKKRVNLSEAMEELGGDLRERLCGFVFQECGWKDGQQEKMLKDCIRKIRERRLKRDKGELLKRIKEAERGKEGKGLEALLKEHQALARGEKFPEG